MLVFTISTGTHATSGYYSHNRVIVILSASQQIWGKRTTLQLTHKRRIACAIRRLCIRQSNKLLVVFTVRVNFIFGFIEGVTDISTRLFEPSFNVFPGSGRSILRLVNIVT